MRRTARLVGACLLLLAASCSPSATKPCTFNAQCGMQLCVAGRCQDPADAACTDDTDCTSPPRCQVSLGCEAGHCTYGAAPAGAPCDDGNACTDLDVCDGAGSCTSATSICSCNVVAECPAAPGPAACHTITCPSGTCQYTPQPDVICGGATCVGSTTYIDQRCDVSGGCLPTSGTPCPGRLKCDSAGLACRSSCANASDCVAGLICTGGTCANPPCTTPAQCTVPPGNPACFTAACTGNMCQYPVVANAVCGGATCLVATLYTDQRCDGAGACMPNAGTLCANNLRCNAVGTGCKATCVGNQDCQTGFVCNVAKGACEDPTGDGGDGNVALATSVDIGTGNVGADSDDNGGSADGVAYRVMVNPTTTSIDVGTSPAGFVAGDKALLIDLQGLSGDVADLGNYEIVDVTGTAGNTVTLAAAPTKSYDGTSFANQRVFLQRLPQYNAVTIGAGGTLTAGAYDGTTATGIVAFYAHTVTVQAGGKIDVTAKGHAGGAGAGGACPDGPTGVWCANGDVGKPGAVGMTVGGESNGGNGGNGGGVTNAALGKGGNGSDSGQYSVAAMPGKGGTGYQGGGGGGARNDNSPGFQDGAGGGGKPYTYGAITDTLRTDAACTKISLSAGAAQGAGGGAAGTPTVPGNGGSIAGGTSGGRGAGVVFILAGTITTGAADQIVAMGGVGGAGIDGGSGITNNRNCGGGGGGGAQGASGGSLCLSAKTFNVVAGSLSTKGGRGGDGGKGGLADDAVCPGSAALGGAGIGFTAGNDVGGAGGVGQVCGAGSGGGGGGGNSGWGGRISMAAL